MSLECQTSRSVPCRFFNRDATPIYRIILWRISPNKPAIYSRFSYYYSNKPVSDYRTLILHPKNQTMLTLFPDERIVSRSFDGSIVLTTHRISYEYESSGKSYNQSILLEQVTSCEDYCNRPVISLIVGGVSMILGFSAVYGDQIEAALALIVLAIACGIYYWMSRKSFLVISSPDSKMMINTNGMRKDLVFVFINRIEQTKHARLVKLSRGELMR